jgi:hypothetical protein
MTNTRRQLLFSSASFATFLSLSPRLFQAQTRSPEYRPSPNAPDPNFPQGMNGPGPAPPDPKSVNQQNQAEIRADVDKLSALVSDLKKELSVTNTSSVLSIAFVKNAHQVEKLAKHIRELAKG